MRNLEESDPRRQESGKVASRGWGRGRVYWILSFCFARRKEFRLHNKVTLLNTTEQRCSKTCLTIVNFMWCVFYHNFKKCSLGGTTRLYVPRYGLHWDVHSPGYEARFFFFFWTQLCHWISWSLSRAKKVRGWRNKLNDITRKHKSEPESGTVYGTEAGFLSTGHGRVSRAVATPSKHDLAWIQRASCPIWGLGNCRLDYVIPDAKESLLIFVSVLIQLWLCRKRSHFLKVHGEIFQSDI